MTREEKFVAALTKARDVFQTYGDLHRSKSPPQLDKARANYAMVSEINKTLTSEDDQPTLSMFDRVASSAASLGEPYKDPHG